MRQLRERDGQAPTIAPSTSSPALRTSIKAAAACAVPWRAPARSGGQPAPARFERAHDRGATAVVLLSPCRPRLRPPTPAPSRDAGSLHVDRGHHAEIFMVEDVAVVD